MILPLFLQLKDCESCGYYTVCPLRASNTSLHYSISGVGAPGGLHRGCCVSAQGLGARAASPHAFPSKTPRGPGQCVLPIATCEGAGGKVSFSDHIVKEWGPGGRHRWFSIPWQTNFSSQSCCCLTCHFRVESKHLGWIQLHYLQAKWSEPVI